MTTDRARLDRGAQARRRDIGKLIMVPVAAIVLAHDIRLLTHLGMLSRPGDGALRWAGTALTCLFYGLIILCYFRRPPAVATYQSVASWAVAIIATMAPFPLPFLPSTTPGAARQLAADLLLTVGTAGAIWSLWYLGRNVSVIAQARAVSERGPYRFVRHPLYTAEMISALGLALAAGTLATFAAWVVLCAMQVYRARCEERILLRTLPAYAGYRWRTPALVPGIARRRSGPGSWRRGVAEQVNADRHAADRGRLAAHEHAGRARLSRDHEAIADVLQVPADLLNLRERDGGA